MSIRTLFFFSLVFFPLIVQAQIGNVTANPDRMEQRTLALGEFGENPEGGVSRAAFGDADRAGHDAQDMARIAPTGMIFVPSRNGISHSPEEFTSPVDMANGASVLLKTVLAIDGGALE